MSNSLSFSIETRLSVRFLCFWLFLGVSLFACFLPTSAAAKTPNGEVIDLRALLAREAEQGSKSATMVVLYHDPAWSLTWVEVRECGTIGLLPSDSLELPLGLAAGDALRLFAQDNEAGGEDLFVELLGEAAPVAAEPVAGIPVARDGRPQLVELVGYALNQALLEPRRLVCEAIVDGRRVFFRTLLEKGEEIPKVEGQFVRARGLWVSRPGAVSESVERVLWIQGANRLEPLGDETLRRFGTLPRPIAGLAGSRQGETVRILGKVARFDLGARLVVEDNSGILEIETEQRTPLPEGASVEIVGMVEKKDGATVLREAVFRPIRMDRLRRESESLLVGDAGEMRSIREVLDAANGFGPVAGRVSVMGVVTFAAPRRGFLILQDNTDAIRVEIPRRLSLRAEVGDLLHVEGSLDERLAKGVTPLVRSERINILGRGDLPQAPLIDLDQAKRRSSFERWVAIDGIVRRARNPRGEWKALDLVGPEGEFVAFVSSLDQLGELDLEVGSVVRVEGVCLWRPGRREQSDDREIHLMVPSWDHVGLLAEGPSEPFELPVSSFEAVKEKVASGGLLGAVRIEGSVLQVGEEGTLTLSDGSRSLHVLGLDIPQAERGSWLSVVGVPGEESGHAALRGIDWRRGHALGAIQAQDLRTERELMRLQDAELVRFRGQLLSIVEDDSSFRLILSQGEHSVIVILKKATDVLHRWPFALGDTVEAMGVLRVLEDPISGLAFANIALREEDDVRLVEPGPFWDARRLMFVVFLSLIALIVGLLWALYLSGRVRKQQREVDKQRRKGLFMAESNRRIMDHASDFVFTVDLEGRFLSYNAAGERMTGYSEEEARQMTIYAFLDRRDSLLVGLALRRRRTKANLGRFKVQITRKDRRRIWVDMSPSLLEEEGQVVGGMCIARDITREVEEREALQKAKALAESNAELKARFLATMSHELRTPMNGVIGMMNVLMDTDLTEDQRDCAQTVLTSSQALHELLCSILDYSKLEAGAMVAEKTPFSPKSIVSESIKLIGPSASAKGIALDAQGLVNLPDRLVGDPGRLRQLLINMLGNAVKFTEKGSVDLKIALGERRGATLEVLFEVVDTGIGVDANELENLFLPFHQADSSYARRFGGTGLGLTICRQLVEMLGGQIGVESAKGIGSRFWFRLPFETLGAAVTPLAVEEAKPKENPKKRSWAGPAIKILVAEDNPVNQKMMRLHLKRIGLEADYVENGAEALEAVGRVCYDLILMDIQMPVMDGLEATRRIKRIERNRTLPIIAVTANTAPEDQRKCLEAGMDHFVGKPFDAPQILDAIERVMSRC